MKTFYFVNNGMQRRKIVLHTKRLFLRSLKSGDQKIIFHEINEELKYELTVSRWAKFSPVNIGKYYPSSRPIIWP